MNTKILISLTHKVALTCLYIPFYHTVGLVNNNPNNARSQGLKKHFRLERFEYLCAAENNIIFAFLA